MISPSYLSSIFNKDDIETAKNQLLIDDAYVSGITLEKIGSMWELSGYAKDETRFTDRSFMPYVYFSEQKEFITDFTCDCTMFYRHKTCPHIPALILKYQEEHKDTAFTAPSDADITSLLKKTKNAYTKEDTIGLVHLYPCIDVLDNHLQVTFEIGIPHETRNYIVRDIGDLIYHIENNLDHSYGKQLHFSHALSAFDAKSQQMVVFLKSIVFREDSYQHVSYLYNMMPYNPSIHRDLDLKGRYLDDFLRIVGDDPVIFLGKPVHFVHDMPQIPLTMLPEEQGEGYYLAPVKLDVVSGNKQLVLVYNDMFYVVERSSEKLVHLLEFLAKHPNAQSYIAKNDLPTFTASLYPTIQKHFKLNAKNYNPDQWLPIKPKYEIYLDLTVDNTVTCGLYAVYNDKRYNITFISDINGSERRDANDEMRMNELVQQYFTNLNPVQRNFNLRDDDDKLYDLISRGIPSFQSIADVYISDNLKKIRLKKMPKVTLGVSVNQNNLLDISLNAKDMSMKEVSEILSKYDRKKKFYRLKNGDIIDLSDNESFAALESLQETLRLTKAEMSEGQASLPMYRAMYLDAMDDVNIELDRDKKFKDLIQNLNEIDIDAYKVPKDLESIMRDYQKEGFRWLSALYKNGFGALLADDMGLGKTLQVLSFLKAHQTGKTLIACPASLVYNWYSEIQKFTPELSCIMIQGQQEIRKIDIQNAEDNTILVTSYDTLKRDIELYKDIHFQFEVIDEAQFIKNAGTLASKATKDINASFKIALTGTPIENRLSEMWSIFDYLMPGFFYSYRYFKDAFEMRIVRDKDPLIEAKFQKMIRPFVLRRMKKDVLKDLPEKMEEVYYASADPEQRQLYNAHVSRIKANLGKKSDDEFKENKIEFLSELTKLRQLCCDPKLLYANYQGNSAKEELCIDLVKKAIEGGHKVLLFSQFTSMLDILTKRLRQEKIDYYLLTGATSKPQRARMVSAFQSDDVPVFCISLKAGGTGLNLTAADIVIHYDPWWNTAVENQASDRAHRIGQENVVSVYRLIVKDTIEERILELQTDKADLADRVMNGEGMQSAAMSREDFLALLD